MQTQEREFLGDYDPLSFRDPLRRLTWSRRLELLQPLRNMATEYAIKNKEEIERVRIEFFH